jgi:hypothetical protein
MAPLFRRCLFWLFSLVSLVTRSDAVHINYLRDVPLGLGLIALCVGIFTNGIEIKIDPNSPQWLCRPMLLLIGTLLICFSFVGQFTTQ